MSPESLLRAAYAVNLFILVPVCFAMFAGPSQATQAVFQGKLANVDGYRLLVASLWLGIAVTSALGLAWPRMFVGVLVLQVIYKAAYLALFIWPAWRAGGLEAIPMGVTMSFLVIALAWPPLIAAATR